MRLGRVFYLIGRISLILGAAMVLPLAVALFYGDGDAGAFLWSIPVCLLGGLVLMALCRTESTYDLSLLERKSPIGLMQLMPRTVTGSGWSIEEVRDKHGNIQFGASYIAALIEMYNGNETKALAAYNQGSGKVASGNYSTGYSAKVQSYRTSLINWCRNHGYSNTFHEVSERLTGK